MHVKKGLSDGLFISSVGCASDLWGIIMDAGTGFNQQLYRVVPDAFLPKEWIMEKWDLGYYITAVAGDAPPHPHSPGFLNAIVLMMTVQTCSSWSLLSNF